MDIKQCQIVTIVSNKTSKEITGKIIEYTPERITLLTHFDAKEVHFKEES